MDKELLGAVKSQTIDMGTFDTIACFTNIPYVLFFKNATSAPDFMTTPSLKQSLYKTLARFPYLLADIHTNNMGKGNLTVDAENLNLPDFRETTSTVSYETLESQNFAWSAWPSNLTTANFMAEPDQSGRLKMVHVNVVRLHENSGVALFINVHHYATDAKGSFEFVNQWAATCAESIGVQTEYQQMAVPPVFDRKVVMSQLPETRRQGSKTTREIFGSRSLLAGLLALIPMDKYVASAVQALGNGENQAHIFRISRITLDTLRSDLQPLVPEGMRISNNDLLVALVSKTIGQSQNEARAPPGFLGSVGSAVARLAGMTSDWQPVEVVVDARRHLGLQDMNYVGGALVLQHFVNPLKEVWKPTTLEGLAKIVVRSRGIVEAVDAKVVRDYVEVIEANPGYMFRLTAHSTIHEKLASFSNHSRVGMYDVDFGHGTPVWVSPTLNYPARFTTILGCPAPSTDMLVYITMDKPTMAKVLENKFFMDRVALVY